MTYTLYCKITFWSKDGICWLPNSRFSERISNAKARNFPFKPAPAQSIEAQFSLMQNVQIYFQAETKIRFQRIGGFLITVIGDRIKCEISRKSYILLK